MLQRAKELDPATFTKSGIMVGLGESRNEVLQLMDDLRSANVDFLTIGQYLQPTRKHAPVKEFITPEAFKAYERIALAKGLSAGVVEPADAVELSRGRRFRQAEGGALSRSRGDGVRRVLVIGCSGAGKTTFAVELAARTGLPLVHLDKEFWRPGWTMPPRSEWRARVAELIAQPAWILEGNFDSSLDLRLPRADTVIWFDMPRHLCLRRVAKRIVTTHGKVRPDMGPGCPEKIDFAFLKWIWNFNRTERPKSKPSSICTAPTSSPSSFAGIGTCAHSSLPYEPSLSAS